MKKLLNTLYVTIPEAYLACDGENVLVRVDGEIKFRMPVHNLEGIVCFGFSGASPSLMYLCCDKGISISFLSPYGKFKGRVTGRTNGNVLLRKAQYSCAENPEKAIALSKKFISSKIANSTSVLNRGIRDHRDVIDVNLLKGAVIALQSDLKKVQQVCKSEVLLGVEGHAASSYFGVFDQLILHQKTEFYMAGRNRRPPKDRVNAILSFLYTLLTHEIISALEVVGLDPQYGFFHKLRPGRPSLALDMLEELRAYLVDRMALTLINKNQISSKGFVIKENGAVIMDEETRKIILTAWQKRKHDEIQHPFLEEKISVGLIPYVQSMLLARYLRGDLDDYPPFFMK